MSVTVVIWFGPGRRTLGPTWPLNTTRKLTPGQETHKDLYAKSSAPSKDGITPWQGENGETDVLAKQEQGGLLPGKSAELDVVPGLLGGEGREDVGRGVRLGGLFVRELLVAENDLVGFRL